MSESSNVSTSLKNLLLVWDWTLRFLYGHRYKNSKDKQGFIERMFNRFGRDGRRLQLLFLSDPYKFC